MFYIFASFFYIMSNIDFATITMSNETGSEYQVNNGYVGGIYNGAISLLPYGILNKSVVGSHFAMLQNNENGIAGFPFNLKYQMPLSEGDFASGNFFAGSYVWHNEGKIKIANSKQNFYTLYNEILQLGIDILQLQNEVFSILETLTVVTGTPGASSPLDPSIASQISAKKEEIAGKITTLQEKKQALAELLF